MWIESNTFLRIEISSGHPIQYCIRVYTIYVCMYCIYCISSGIIVWPPRRGNKHTYLLVLQKRLFITFYILFCYYWFKSSWQKKDVKQKVADKNSRKRIINSMSTERNVQYFSGWLALWARKMGQKIKKICQRSVIEQPY